MSTAMGVPPEGDFTHPLRLLSDCHRRIERFLDQLIQVTEQARGGSLEGEQREALDVALRYFAKAVPLHTHDEEESLFPRMRATGSAEANEALAVLESLESDHRSADEAHAEVERLGRRWLAAGNLAPEDAVYLRNLLRNLRAMYQRHIAVEDDRVFPLASKVLERPAISTLGREMAERRGLDPDHLPALSRCAQRRLAQDLDRG